MTQPRIDWSALEGAHHIALIDAIKSLFANGGPFETSAEILASGTNRSTAEAEGLLMALCPPLQRVSVESCPNCGNVLSDDEAALESCPSCRQRFAEYGGIRLDYTFVYHAPRTRDVVWVLALHGMNTRGAWQEEFNWRVSTAYGRSVPVAIYKYGLVRPGAIWRPSLRRKVVGLMARIQALRGDTEDNGFVGQPDVIAHSLGTWLIGHALQWNPSLHVGRVILIGSILRPDFDWGKLLARGQVEAVLNNYGTKDFWARIAQFVIPDSGPSGRSGFDTAASITQVQAENFGHSDFFIPKNFEAIFNTVWRPFLTGETSVDILAAAESRDWIPALWIFRATLLPFFLLTAYWAIVFGSICSCLLGAYEAYRWLRGT